MAQVLIDSDLFSELLAQKDPVVGANAAKYFKEFGNYTISAMTFFESQKGLTYKPKPKITAALTSIIQDLIVIPVRKEEAELGGIIHGLLKQQGRTIGEADPVIAATAITYGLTLATGNIKHYQFVIDAGFPIQLENWRQP